MQVQINAGHNIEGGITLADKVEGVVRSTLDRFSDRITRLEIHLTDENSKEKSGADDKRCVLEARVAGRPPIAVSHNAATIEQAVDGATERMKHSLDSTLGRIANH